MGLPDYRTDYGKHDEHDDDDDDDDELWLTMINYD